jgi:hypothetical protein
MKLYSILIAIFTFSLAMADESVNYVLTHNSYGPIKIGMKENEVKELLPGKLVDDRNFEETNHCHIAYYFNQKELLSFMFEGGILTVIYVSSKEVNTSKAITIGAPKELVLEKYDSSVYIDNHEEEKDFLRFLNKEYNKKIPIEDYETYYISGKSDKNSHLKIGIRNGIVVSIAAGKKP